MAVRAFFGFRFAGRVVVGYVEFVGIGIIVDETVEFERDDSFHEVFGREPREPFEGDGQVGGNLFFIDFYFLDAVDEVVELFFANLFPGGYGAFFEFLADDAFDVAHAAFLFHMYDGDGGACLAGPAGASAAVGVGLDVFGQAVVDDMGEVVDIEPPGGDVGGDEQLQVVQAELLHHRVALLLREVAVQGVGVVAVLDEGVGDFLGFEAGAAEDDAVDVGVVVGNAFQCEVFVFGVDEVIDVFDVFGAFVFAADDYFAGGVHVLLGDAGDVGGHGGREEQHLALFGYLGEYLVDAVGKSHVEHLVGFVHDDGAHLVEVHHAAVDEVDEATGGGDDDVHAFFQGAYLALDARTSVDGEHFQPLDVCRVVVEVTGDLQAELAGGAENEGLGREGREVGLLYDGQPEGGCLAGACLGEGYDVGFLVEQERYDLFLHGHGLFISELGNGFENFGANAQFFESLHVCGVISAMNDFSSRSCWAIFAGGAARNRGETGRWQRFAGKGKG